MAQTITIKDVQTVKTYFRGNAKYGRTTTLINKATGETLGSWMGCASKKDAFRAYQEQGR